MRIALKILQYIGAGIFVLLLTALFGTTFACVFIGPFFGLWEPILAFAILIVVGGSTIAFLTLVDS